MISAMAEQQYILEGFANTMSITITVLCPKLSCRAILRVPENARGERVRCSGCGTAFLVPQKKPGRKEVATASAPKSES